VTWTVVCVWYGRIDYTLLSMRKLCPDEEDAVDTFPSAVAASSSLTCAAPIASARALPGPSAALASALAASSVAAKDVDATDLASSSISVVAGGKKRKAPSVPSALPAAIVASEAAADAEAPPKASKEMKKGKGSSSGGSKFAK
jgi:hypothetical protein